MADVFPTVRRYYLTKAYQAGETGDTGLRGAWLAKQAAEPGTALGASVPYQSDLAALVPPFTTVEDLTGSSVDELVRVGLPRPKAQAVITALG